MRRFIARGVIAALVVAMCAGVLASMPMTASAHGSSAQRSAPQTQQLQQTQQAQPLTRMPDWAQRAAPYVTIGADGVAVINPAIASALSQRDLQAVRKAVATYNGLPVSVRLHPHIQGTLGRGANVVSGGGGGGCSYNYWMQVQWWGVTLYINHCIIIDVNAGILGSAAIAGLIAGICGVLTAGTCAIVAAALAAYIVIYDIWIVRDDDHCGDRGVFVDRSWNGTIWIDTVC